MSAKARDVALNERIARLPPLLSLPLLEAQNELDGTGSRTIRRLPLRSVQLCYERRRMQLTKPNELRRREDETRCQLRVAKVADMNNVGHS